MGAKSVASIKGEPSDAKSARFIRMKLLPQTAPKKSKSAGAIQGRGEGDVGFTAREIRIHWVQDVLIGFYLRVMRTIIGIISALGVSGMLSLSGCSEGNAHVAVHEHYEAGSRERSVARLEIEGMMCAVACGSKIQKELLELNGVSNANIDFDAAREQNFIEVEFTADLVSPDDMANKVHEIAGGIYQVHAVEVTHFAPAVN